MTVLEILDRSPADGSTGPGSEWFAMIESSLRGEREEWFSETSEVEWLSDDRSWVLLSWVEDAATQIVRMRSQKTLEVAIFGLSLLIKSRLDRRDIDLVGALIRRGATLAGLRYEDGVAAGCRWAGSLGDVSFPLVMRLDSATPPTHIESTDAEGFLFERRAPEFDVSELERWLDGDSD